MNPSKALFSSVLTRFLESITPQLNNFIEHFDAFAQADVSENDLEAFLSLNFASFPREHSDYKDALRSLTMLANNSTSEILHFISQQFKDILRRGNQNLFLSISNQISKYNPSSSYHQTIMLFFGLYFTSDLICQILAKCHASDAGTFLIRTGGKFINADLPFHKLQQPILRQWSIIASIISETMFSLVAQSFFMHTDTENMNNVFTFYQYTRLDHDPDRGNSFMTKVLQILKNLRSKKTLTNSILESTSSMILTFPDNQELYKAYLEFGWNLLSDKLKTSGAISLVASVLPKIQPIKTERIKTFTKTYLLNITKETKLPTVLNAFKILNLSDKFDPNWMIWEYGYEPRVSQMSFINWSRSQEVNQSDPSSSSSLFMKYLFPKADFSACPEVFADVLIHIASLDPENYVTTILPRFLSLHITDPRILTFFVAVSKINSPDFISFSNKPVTTAIINEHNRLIRSIVLPALSNFEESEESLYFESQSDVNKIEAAAAAKTLAVGDVLEKHHIRTLDPYKIEIKRSTWEKSEFELKIQIVKMLRYVLNQDDFGDTRILNLITSLVNSPCYMTAKYANATCLESYARAPLCQKLILALTERIRQPTNSIEASLQYCHIILKLMDTNNALALEAIHNVEATCYLMLASSLPAIREMAFQILSKCNDMLYQKGIYGIIMSLLDDINKVATLRLRALVCPEEPGTMVFPDEGLSFNDTLGSYYYDVWLLYYTELVNVMVAVEYEPIRAELASFLSPFITSMTTSGDVGNPMDIGVMILFLASNLDSRATSSTSTYYHVRSMCQTTRTNDFRPAAFSLMTSLLSHLHQWCKILVFSAMTLAHPFLSASLIGIFPNVKKHLIPLAIPALVQMLKSPYLTGPTIRASVQKIAGFLTSVQSYFVQMSVNSPRTMEWDANSEKEAADSAQMILDYCIIVNAILHPTGEPISTDEWAIASREITFRFMLNWKLTKSKELESVRKYANATIIEMVRSGPVYNDSLSIDDSAIKQIAASGVLDSLLQFHTELLLSRFLSLLFFTSRETRESLFSAIILCLTPDNFNAIYPSLGQLILAISVMENLGNPESNLAAEALSNALKQSKVVIDVLTNIPFSIPIDAFTDYYGFAIESVFYEAFRVITSENLNIHIVEITKALLPWTKHMRLLPKQRHCAQNISEDFAFFTPYQFLASFIKATQSTSEAGLVHMAKLWISLMELPDHKNIIPMFLLSWTDKGIVKALLKELVRSELIFLELIMTGVTFSRYFYMTQCLHEEFTDYHWSVELLIPLLKTKTLDDDHLAKIIIFGLLFHDGKGEDLLYAACRSLGITVSRGEFSINYFKVIVEKIVNVFKKPEKLGDAALIWLLGSSDIKFAALSLIVFNKVLSPIEPLVITGVCKAVIYHLTNNNNSTYIDVLLNEAFVFYSKVFEGNETYCYSFAAAFLDSQLYSRIDSTAAIELFMHALSSQHTNTKSWAEIVQIIRPLLPKLENGLAEQKILDMIITTSTNADDLLMIVAPLRLTQPMLFPSSPSWDELLNESTESTLIKVLPHYAYMLSTASTELTDAILKISTAIVNKIKIKEDKASIAKITQIAIHNIKQCENALSFLEVISRLDPSVVSFNFLEISEWNRDTVDVLRALRRLPTNDAAVPPVTITDCSSISSVYNILNPEAKPRILPYAVHKEMMSGMIIIKDLSSRHATARKVSFRAPIKPSRRTVTRRDSNTISLGNNWQPIREPQNLVIDPSLFDIGGKNEFVTTVQDYLSFETGSTDI